MNCPYCSKHIHGFTGLQELQKFQKHLKSCKKNPDRLTVINVDGKLKKVIQNNTLLDALNKRAESGQ